MSILATGLGLAGTAVSSIFGSSQARKQREAQRQSEKDAREHNLRMWNLQNQYNHPSSQMARLQEAGLNPNMIYGTSPSSAVGTAGDVSPGKAPDQEYYQQLDLNPLGEMMKYQNVRQSRAQVDNLRAQNDVLVQDSLLKAGQTADLAVKTARGKFDYDIAKELKDTHLEAARLSVDNMKADIRNKTIDHKFKDETFASRAMDITLGVRNARATLKGTKLRNELMEYDKELRALGIERSDQLYERILGRILSELNINPLKDTAKQVRQWFD